jgi:hypothetical protein
MNERRFERPAIYQMVQGQANLYFPISAWVAKINQGPTLVEAEQRRRPSGMRAARARRREHILASIGTRLIFAGLWLRARYEPVT